MKHDSLPNPIIHQARSERRFCRVRRRTRSHIERIALVMHPRRMKWESMRPLRCIDTKPAVALFGSTSPKQEGTAHKTFTARRQSETENREAGRAESYPSRVFQRPTDTVARPGSSRPIRAYAQRKRTSFYSDSFSSSARICCSILESVCPSCSA